MKGIASSPASRKVSRRAAGRLSGEPKWGLPRFRQPVGDRLEHDPLRSRDAAEQRQLLGRHDAGVRVWEEAGLLEHERGDLRQVLDRRLAAERRELVPRHAVASLGLVAEREQSLVTAGGGACAGDLEHFLVRQVRALAASRRSRERAVVADVPAELGQRDEDLGRERDERSLAAGAELLGGAEQRRCVDSGERQRIRSVEPLAEASLRQSCRCPCHGSGHRSRTG